MTVEHPKHTAPQNAVVWYPNQRVIRTALTALVGFFPVAVIVLGVLAQAWPTEWLLAAAATSVAVQSALTKVMTHPVVNAWLIENTMFGTSPQGTLVEPVDPE